MYAEESPWFEKGRSDLSGFVWYPDDNDTWYRVTASGETIYRHECPNALPWAQGWKG